MSGIVRAINKDTRELFLLTPLREDKLNEVNCLLKGLLSLPEKLFIEPPDSVIGHIPYVRISNNVLGCEVKKTFKTLGTKNC